jgi:hypothetical protein
VEKSFRKRVVFPDLLGPVRISAGKLLAARIISFSISRGTYLMMRNLNYKFRNIKLKGSEDP